MCAFASPRHFVSCHTVNTNSSSKPLFCEFVSRDFNGRLFSFFLLSLLFPRSSQRHIISVSFCMVNFFLGHLLSMSHFWWYMCEGIPIKPSTLFRPRALPLSCQSIIIQDLSHKGLADIFRAKQTVVLAYQLLGFHFLSF